MTYCISWWNSLRGCHDLLFIMMELLQGMSWSGTRLQFSQILVEILCGDVHLLQFLSEDIKSNEQYKLQKKTKWKSTNQYKTNTKPIQNQYKDFSDYVIHDFSILLFIPWTDVTFMMLFSERHYIFIMNNVKWNSIF